jgi:hypothetical protein
MSPSNGVFEIYIDGVLVDFATLSKHHCEDIEYLINVSIDGYGVGATSLDGRLVPADHYDPFFYSAHVSRSSKTGWILCRKIIRDGRERLGINDYSFEYPTYDHNVPDVFHEIWKKDYIYTVFVPPHFEWLCDKVLQFMFK